MQQIGVRMDSVIRFGFFGDALSPQLLVLLPTFSPMLLKSDDSPDQKHHSELIPGEIVSVRGVLSGEGSRCLLGRKTALTAAVQ